NNSYHFFNTILNDDKEGTMKKQVILGAFLIWEILFFSLSGYLYAPESIEGEEIKVDEKTLSMMPCLYLNKRIMTMGVFLDVSNSLLDDWHHDKCTRFSSQEYINFRTIGDNTFQYFMKQKDAVKIIPQLKTGDKIIICGYVKSCADKRPWVEVSSVSKAPAEE
ncbi:MAG: hypothetical protein N3A64_03210, partial [Desulfobacterota bacterium]|nr:hypothetical protein [Thermodesulfobacteriota bacterium]